MQGNKMVETSCYIVGAGAFGVFCRWMQRQIAFEENGLVKGSVWNILVLIYIAAAAIVFYRITDSFRKKKQFIPANLFDAFENEGKLYQICRWAIGGLMCVGSILLFLTCETDKNSTLLKILSVMGILSGVSFTFVMASANRPAITKRLTMSVCMTLPVITYCFWLIISYKANSINSVVWQFAIEILTLVVCILAFYRMAGFGFGFAEAQKSHFLCCIGAVLCIMSIADGRNFGQQIMLISTATMFLYYNWVMVSNLRQKIVKPKEEDEPSPDGFEHL